MGQAPRTVPDYFKPLKKSLVLTFRDSVGEYQPTSRKATTQPNNYRYEAKDQKEIQTSPLQPGHDDVPYYRIKAIP